MIKINMFSEADSVKGQGVGSAYLELVRLLKTNLSDVFEVTINDHRQTDLTHYHTINPTFYLNSFSKKRGRIIGYVHFLPQTLAGSIKLPKVAMNVFYKYVISFYNRMDQIVVVNPIFIDKLVELGIKRERIRYIPNFVSKTVFYEKTAAEKAEIRQRLNIPSDKFVVFGDGQVQERKGVDDFVKLAQANPDLLFIWAGGFSFGKITDGYDHYKKLVDNPPANVRFTGIIERSELVDYCNICDLFLLPSFDELFPMSLLEAFSCGAPVLVRDLELYRAILDGYYLAGKDFTELDQQIKNVVAHPEILTKYRKLSAEASDKYSEAHLTNIWRQFYTEQYRIGVEKGQIRK